MRVSPEQLARGIARYVRESVAPKVTDDPALKVAMLFVAKRIEKDPAAVGALKGSPALALLGADGKGEIDIDGVAGDLSAVIEDAGGLPVTIPAIPVISPDEKVLTFTAEDVRELAKIVKESK